MRVDSQAPAAAGELDPRTRAKQYFGAVRRRWYLPVCLALLGFMVGWISTPAPPKPNKVGKVVAGPTYYRATHVLIVDNQGDGNGGSSPSVNLSQAAYLVNTGEVPKRVAKSLGMSESDVESMVIGLPRTNVNSVEVQAVSPDVDKALKVADSAAGELLVVLADQAKQDAERNRDQVIARLDDLNAQINALNDRIAANPPDRIQLEAQQRSLANQYSMVYEQFSQMANNPPPTAGLRSLEGARALPISKDAYKAALGQIRDGADYVTGNAPPPEATSEPAPTTVEKPASKSSRGATGFVVGAAMGLGLALVLDRFDNRLRRRADIESISGLTVIAELPPLSRKEQQSLEVVADTQHRSRSAEAYRVIRGALLFAQAGEGRIEDRDEALVVMVTSGNPAEGKTTVTANLAAVLAEGGLDVLVLNCDFRRPKVHKYLHPEDDHEPAVATTPGGTVKLIDTQIERVRLVTGVGEDDPDANPLDVIAMQRKIVETAKKRYDVILLDTAPFLTTNDASELLGVTDHLLFVVRAGKTRTEALALSVEILERLEAPVLGIVVNDSHETQAAQYYYYGYTDDRAKASDKDEPDDSATGRPTGVSPLSRVRSVASGR